MSKGTTIVGFILSFVAGMLLMWGIDKNRPASTHAATPDTAQVEVGAVAPPNANAVKVEMYVMSQCPYGVQAEEGMKDSVAQLGADLDLQIDYIGNESPAGLTSMHGPKEVAGDTVQLCVKKYAPAKHFSFIMCQNKNYRMVDTNWEACAKDSGIPADKIRSCLEGDEGKQLLKESFGRAKAKGASGSPTIYIGGKKYSGGRRGADFMRAICAEYKGAKPAACSDIPEAPPVNVTILNDKRCAECNPGRALRMITSTIAKPVMKNLDYSDADGKKLYDEVKPGKLPVIIFDDTLAKDNEASTKLGRNLRESGSYKIMTIGGWNPACADEGGCELEECKSDLVCREEIPNKLDVFVMSQCPFGVKALNAMEEVLKNFEGRVAFDVHFIGDGDAAALKSMHGQGEVDEDIREMCAIKHYAKDYKYMDYILCRNKNIKSPEWEQCTGEATGIDAKVIKECFEGEDGKALLAKSFEVAKGLGIGASPTWLANNRFKFSGIDAETVRANLCQHNKDLKGCENKLSGDTGKPAPGGCGG